MNTDDFEKRLQRQPLRQIPAEWRGQILDACVRQEAVTEDLTVPAWRLFLARFPAWGAVAALWVVLLSINAWLAGSEAPERPGKVVAGSVQSMALWSQHSAALQKLATEDQSLDGETPERPPALKPNQPRSERRRDWQSGAVRSEPTLTA